MEKGFVFWLLMLLWVISGIYIQWPSASPRPPGVLVVDSILLFVLLFLLGWHAFGFMIH